MWDQARLVMMAISAMMMAAPISAHCQAAAMALSKTMNSVMMAIS